MEDLKFMDEALALAREAAAEGEVPVGCVITRNGQIVGRGRNRRERDKTALGHAEIEAIGEACRNLGGWRRDRLFLRAAALGGGGACGQLAALFAGKMGRRGVFAEISPITYGDISAA